MVFGQSVDIVLQCVQAGCREVTGLAHSAAGHLSPLPGFGDEFVGANQDAPDRRSQTFRQTQRNRIEVLRDLADCDPVGDRSIEGAGPVEVKAKAVFVGEVPGRGEIPERQYLAGCGVFESQQFRAGVMMVVGFDV